MNKEQKKILVRTIEESEPWERISTTVEGLYVVKPPEQNNRQNVLVEAVPTPQGQIAKKKGIYIKTLEDLKAYRVLLNNPKTEELIKVISEYYGKRNPPKIEI